MPRLFRDWLLCVSIDRVYSTRYELAVNCPELALSLVRATSEAGMSFSSCPWEWDGIGGMVLLSAAWPDLKASHIQHESVLFECTCSLTLHAFRTLHNRAIHNHSLAGF
jgi:hypothetical protein